MPDFFIIGAMKAGTTSLHLYLDQHPGVFTSRPKEPHYFSSEDYPDGLAEYQSLFHDAPSTALVGESSTSYTKIHSNPEAPDRIAKAAPGAKLIYVVRDPIQRIVSHYQHNVRRGRETRPFDEAVRKSRNYVNISRYGWQLNHYLERFPRDQILVLTTESLLEHPHETVGRSLRFLGVDGDVEGIDFRNRYNTAQPPRRRARLRTRPCTGIQVVAGRLQVSDWMRAELAECLRDDIVRLREVLGHDFHCWGLLD